MRDRNAPLGAANVSSLAWDKMNGLLPVIVQDQASGRTLMLGYMNLEALGRTLETGRATFFSRSKGRLWEKGETSGNALHVHSIFADCDDDALLLLADPQGPTCHTGTISCFGNEAAAGPGWLADLSTIIRERASSNDEASYTRKLLGEGTQRIAQKIGEEGVEVALAAVGGAKDHCAEEIADLLYHLAVLMESMNLAWDEVVAVLQKRHRLMRPPS